MSERRACVTGAAGFIGSFLCRKLWEDGWHVTALDCCGPEGLGLVADLLGRARFAFVQGDATQGRDVEEAASGADVIFHLASVVGVGVTIQDPIRTIRNNIDGMFSVLEVARRQGSKVVFSSSADVYGVLDKVPLEEDDDNLYAGPHVRRWVYARVKSLEEQLCFEYHRRYRLPTVVVRYFNSYGYGMDAHFPRRVIPLFIKSILEGRPLEVVGDGRQTRSFCHVDDMVEGTLLAAQVPEAVGEAFNIGNDEETSILDLARKMVSLAEELGMARNLGWRYLTAGEVYGEEFEDIHRRVPGLAKSRRILGYEPRVGLDEGLRRTLRAYRDRGVPVGGVRR
ncbi:MAG: NAD-dependent epimerase/dehydratase family protein [Armatimonadota bacterium]|nr:NAD-dependent epimerase/dehydratase family protein [Armatimonadota bacterium]MDR7564912.1 NAD-dependent epimerase/dehydratase family protein [Armatimonadota bacterium]